MRKRRLWLHASSTAASGVGGILFLDAANKKYIDIHNTDTVLIHTEMRIILMKAKVKKNENQRKHFPLQYN